MNSTRRRAFRLLSVVLVTTGVYALVGFLVIPAVARRVAVSEGSQVLNHSVTLERIAFNPFTFVTEINGLGVEGRSEGRLAGIDHARINFDPLRSLFTWRWQFGEITVDAPQAKLVVQKDGTLNIQDLLDRESEEPAAKEERPAGLPRVAIDRLAVNQGRVEFEDASRPLPYRTEVTPITFALTDFSTAEDATGKYRLSGRSDTVETFEWVGDLGVAPLSSSGSVTIGGVALPAHMPFVAAHLNGEITGGRVSVSTRYRVSLGPVPEAILGPVTVHLQNAAIVGPTGGKSILELADLRIALAQADLIRRSATMESITVRGLRLQVERAADGTLNLASLLQPDEPRAAAVPATTSPEKPWAATLSTVDLSDIHVGWADQGVPGAALEVTEIAFKAQALSSDLSKPFEFQFRARLPGDPGALTVDGSLRPAPLLLTARARMEGVSLAPASPYVRQQIPLEFTQGDVFVEGELRGEQASDARLQASWRGDVSIRSLHVREADAGAELLTWSELSLAGLQAELGSQQVTLKDLKLRDPTLTIVRSAGGEINLARLASTSPATTDSPPDTPADAVPAAPPVPWKAEIGMVDIENGQVRFEDRAVPQGFRSEVENLRVRISQLSTEPGRSSDLTVSASLAGSAPLALTGTLTPTAEPPFSGTRLKLELNNLGLKLLEPYTVQFTGYEVQRGQLRADLEYTVTGATLNGFNHVVLQEFYLGNAVPSPDALNVPIKLGLAVLRNRSGAIELRVPVTGSLTSPEFSLRETIQGAIRNTLTRAATAPFSLLGSLFGGPGVDLSQVSFAAGQSALSAETRTTLDAVSRALGERPALALRISSPIRAEFDTPALREIELSAQLTHVRDRLAPVSEENPKPSSDEDLLRLLHAERVRASGAPRGPDPGTVPSEDAPTQVESAATESRPAWYVRVYRRLFRRDRPMEATAAREMRTPSSPGSPGVTEPGLATPVPLEEIKRELLSRIEISDERLGALAQARAEAIRDYLVATGVAAARITLEPARPEPLPANTTQAPVAFSLQESAPDASPLNHRRL